MADTLILNIPVELRLELMTPVSPYRLDAKRKLLNNIIHEITGVFLVVSRIDFKCPDTRRIVNRRVLITFDRSLVVINEFQELNIHLDMMTRHLFLVAFGVDFTPANLPREAIQSVSTQYAIDGGIADMNIVITCQIPHDAGGP